MIRIGGSDIPVIMGASPWKDRYRLWLEKTGRVAPPPATWPAECGIALESLILRTYITETGGIERYETNYSVSDRECEHFAGKIDAYVRVDGIPPTDEVWEVKWTVAGPDESRMAAWTLQLQWYLMITGVSVGRIVYATPYAPPEAIYITSDLELHTLLRLEARKFLDLCLRDVPPEPERRVEGCAELLARCVASRTAVQATTEHHDLVTEYKSLSNIIARSEERRAEIRGQLLRYLEEHKAKTLVHPQWKAQIMARRGQVDIDALCQKFNISKEAADECRRETTYYLRIECDGAQ